MEAVVCLIVHTAVRGHAPLQFDSISQPHPLQQEAEQCTDVLECAWIPGGGTVT